MSEPIVVKQLSVHVMTAEPSEDPHGQGVAGIWAEIETGDEALIRCLSAQRQEATVLLRCAMLDVSGPIRRALTDTRPAKFTVVIHDLVYRKPKHKVYG